MRAGLSTIQQTLTPEAANVLNQSIAEAGRRSHGQTTPLHVAATLLASPSGFLRQACIKSHPNSSHPLQCRALELCFSVALERLPTAQNAAASGAEPPISNALMAALKRAQAHQRRGCPEQQQQPLLAVKVELEQLVISILDDPSVSRVMREASFSSPAVKATIEQSLNSSAVNASAVNSGPIGIGFRSTATASAPVNRNLYMNPRLQQQQQSSSSSGPGGGGLLQSGNQLLQSGGNHRGDEVKRIIEILSQAKKRNPVLVGESEPEAVIRELFRRIENKELGGGVLKNVQVVRFDKEVVSDMSKIAGKVNELGGLLESKIGCGGVILDLGDLKWLVEQPAGLSSGRAPPQVVSEAGRAAVAEMAKLLARFGEGSSAGRLWMIGTATCETYLRCQVYHPSMENDWDLQAVPITARAPRSGMFPSLGINGILSTSVESFSPLKGFPGSPAALSRPICESIDGSRKVSLCPECKLNYEQDLAKLAAEESEKTEIKLEAVRPSLPQWLQNAKDQGDDVKTANQAKNHEVIMKQKTEELQKKWKDICLRSHPSFHRQNPCLERIVPTPLSVKSLINPNLLACQPIQPKPQVNRNLGSALQLNTNLVTNQPVIQARSPPGSPVRTELALGRTKVNETTPEDSHKEQTRDLLGCMPAERHDRFKELQNEKLLSMLDADNFKRLLKGLLEKVWWQREVASAVATTVTQCRLGNGKRKGKGDIWLFFAGPDRVGKQKMASALAELVNGNNPIMVSLGSRRNDGESGVSFRGKTALDKIVEAVRRNPFSVIMLEDIDKADMLLRGSLKKAMERGRLADSYGREISLGNVIFIVTADWAPDNARYSSSGLSLDDNELASLGSNGLQLRLSLCEKTSKRRANWLHDEHRYRKSRKELSPALSFDLNEAADNEDDRADGSRNSSDLTIDQEVEHGLENRLSSITSSVCGELLKFVDDSVVFKPVELDAIQREVLNSITKRFSSIMGENNISIEIPDKVLEKVLAGLWLDQSSLDEWTENVLVPSFRQLKSFLLTANATQDDTMVTQLEVDDNADSHGSGDWLPSCIKVVTNVL